MSHLSQKRTAHSGRVSQSLKRLQQALQASELGSIEQANNDLCKVRGKVIVGLHDGRPHGRSKTFRWGATFHQRKETFQVWETDEWGS